MIAGAVSRRHRGRRLGSGAAELPRRARRRERLRDTGALGFLDLPRDRALHDQSRDFAQTDARQVRRRRGARNRRIGARPDRAAHGAPQAATGTRSPRRRGAASRGCTCSTTWIPARSPRSSRDSCSTARSSSSSPSPAAPPRRWRSTCRARRAERARRRRGPRPPGVRHRSGEGRAARHRARARALPALDIPPNVGGRFSVLTPVGMLPAALLGMKTTQLLAGAADMREAVPIARPCARTRRGVFAHAAVAGRHAAGPRHPRAHAVLRYAARHRRLVRAALGREPGQAPRARRRRRRAHAARRARRHRPAQPGAALHGRAGRTRR